MSCDLYVHPQRRLAEFRAIVADPSGHSESVVASACDQLILWGDVTDNARARALLMQIADRAKDELNRRARRARLLYLAASILFAVAVGLIAADAFRRLAPLFLE